MGENAGGSMMGQLERRTEAISGEFSSQTVANTLWAWMTYEIILFLKFTFCVQRGEKIENLHQMLIDR